MTKDDADLRQNMVRPLLFTFPLYCILLHDCCELYLLSKVFESRLNTLFHSTVDFLMGS